MRHVQINGVPEIVTIAVFIATIQNIGKIQYKGTFTIDTIYQ